MEERSSDEVIENWKRSVTRHVQAAAKLGRVTERVHVAFMGDETESVADNYETRALSRAW